MFFEMFAYFEKKLIEDFPLKNVLYIYIYEINMNFFFG